MAEIKPAGIGSDSPILSAEELPCPECGYTIEFFSDEKSRHCPSCGFKHFRVVVSDSD